MTTYFASNYFAQGYFPDDVSVNFTPTTFSESKVDAINRIADEIATSTKAYLDKIGRTDVAKSLNENNATQISALNSAKNQILTLLNTESEQIALDYANFQGILAKQNITDIQIADASDITLDIVNKVKIHDEIIQDAFALQNDINGNFFKLEFPILTASGVSLGNFDDVDLTSLRIATDLNSCKFSHLEIISSGVKVYFETAGFVFFEPKPYNINDSRYGKEFKFKVEFLRRKVGDELKSMAVTTRNQTTGELENRIIGL